MKSGMIFFFAGIVFITSCGAKKQTIQTSDKDSSHPTANDTLTSPTTQLNIMQAKDTIITIGNTPIWILSPDGKIKADILVLPGWNFKKEKISQESDFCKKALAKGYRLILPEMMKSVYASQYFPETRDDYKKNLTLTWVTDTMIATLQKDYGIFTGKNNYLHGISTGSRGGAMVHIKTGTLFSKVVLLSGDYDQTKMPADNLMKNTYGDYKSFKERWTNVDNPYNQSTSAWSAQLYIGHGTNDDVVPVQQSIAFADKIEYDHPTCKVIKSFPGAKHDFAFWGGETDAILDFFEK